MLLKINNSIHTCLCCITVNLYTITGHIAILTTSSALQEVVARFGIFHSMIEILNETFVLFTCTSCLQRSVLSLKSIVV